MDVKLKDFNNDWTTLPAKPRRKKQDLTEVPQYPCALTSIGKNGLPNH